jgi:hypothetical protein
MAAGVATNVPGLGTGLPGALIGGGDVGCEPGVGGALGTGVACATKIPSSSAFAKIGNAAGG